MVFTKIIITNCHEKLRKLLLIFFRKIQIMKDICKKIFNPDSLRDNKINKFKKSLLVSAGNTGRLFQRGNWERSPAWPDLGELDAQMPQLSNQEVEFVNFLNDLQNGAAARYS